MRGQQLSFQYMRKVSSILLKVSTYSNIQDCRKKLQSQCQIYRNDYFNSKNSMPEQVNGDSTVFKENH